MSSRTVIQLHQQVVLFAGKGPRYHWLYGRWRLARWLSQWRRPPARLSPSAFFRCLDLDRPGLATLKAALAANDSAAADDRLLVHFQTRSTPRFFFAPDQIPAIVSLVPAEQKAAALQRADDICQGIYQFRRAAPVRFEGAVDWTRCPDGNVDWNWDLNRHLVFETLGRAYAYTGDERYARQFRDLLLHWLACNPPRPSCRAWASVFEVAFRINTWLWAFHYFRGAAAFDAPLCRAMLAGLLQHGKVLAAQLELHAANNHLLLEAKALALLGLMFPEFQLAARWRQRGLALLYREVRAQVCADGVHGERVTHYQRAIAGELLELLVLLERNDCSIPADVIAALGRMLEFELWATKPGGLIPLFGDSGLEDSHTRFSAATAGPAWLGREDLKRPGHALAEPEIWLLGQGTVQRFQSWPARPEALLSRAFPVGGYYVMRQGEADAATYLVVDAAPFGYPPVPVHGHADALNIEVHAYGQDFLVDPGVYATWAPSQWRNFFRGTRAHNTVVVDDQDQSLLVGTRRVYRPAQVTVHRWCSEAHFDLLDASHNGYERLPQPITHRRLIIFAKPAYWLVFDWLEGVGEHTFDLLFHFVPGLTVTLSGAAAAAQVRSDGGPVLNVVPVSPVPPQAEVIAGAVDPIQGWTALYSGQKEPAPVLRYRLLGRAPAQFCTLLFPCPAGQSVPILARPLPVQPGTPLDAWLPGHVLGVQVEAGPHRDLLVIDRRPAPQAKRFAGQSSQAGFVYVRQQAGQSALRFEH
jgi:uncharacterized heparinase superfamily protein